MKGHLPLSTRLLRLLSQLGGGDLPTGLLLRAEWWAGGPTEEELREKRMKMKEEQQRKEAEKSERAEADLQVRLKVTTKTRICRIYPCNIKTRVSLWLQFFIYFTCFSSRYILSTLVLRCF